MSRVTYNWDFEVNRKYVFTANQTAGRAIIRPKAKIREAGSLKAGDLPHFRKALMFVKVRYPKPHRDRDAANLYPTMKAYVDGMTHPDLMDRHNPDLGILPDDNDLYFTGPFISWSGEPHQGDTYLFHIKLIGWK